MTKKFTNSDITVIYNTLNALKGRDDILIGDMDMFWAIRYNLDVFKKHAAFVTETINDKIQSYFTDENTEEIDGQKVIKKELQEEIGAKMDADVRALQGQIVDVSYTSVTLKSLRAMAKANESKLTMLEMTVLEQFVDEETEKKELEVKAEDAE